MATLTETFTNIADAIRSKTETTDKITPENMPAMIEGISVGAAEPVIQELSITSNGTYRAPEGIDGYTPVVVNVPQDGAPTAEELTITGNCMYRFAHNGWDWFLKKYGHQITTKDISDCSYMFQNSSNIVEIPFEINISEAAWGQIGFGNIFANCQQLLAIPKINCSHYGNYSSMENMFNGCWKLRYLPEDIESWFDWSVLDTSTSEYGCARKGLFYNCHSLRSVPMGFLNHGGPKQGYSNSIYNNLFYCCYNLDEVVDLPNPHYNATWGGSYSWYNAFSGAFDYCSRLNRLTFKTQEDGTPYTCNWNYQVIDLSSYVGWANMNTNITGYNSGLTEDTRITAENYDDEDLALWDNPDSWTTDVNYSRYNYSSAVETINSLPDTSAYVAEKGYPNTIKFKGQAGASTWYGPINMMTEEEIAVAVAKGWTVSFV